MGALASRSDGMFAWNHGQCSGRIDGRWNDIPPELVFRVRCVVFRIPSWFGWPDWTCQLNPPDGSTDKKGALRLDESRGFSTENPNMSIRGLFPQQGRDQTRCASDLHVHDVMRVFAAEAADCERLFAPPSDGQVHEPRLCLACHYRNFHLRRTSL